MIGKVGVSQIIVNLPVIKLGLKHLQFSHMGRCGGPPEGARVVHLGTNELLIEQNAIPDGETASPV